jgi:hypothetical protein
MDRQGWHHRWLKRDGAYLHRSTLLLEHTSVHSDFLMDEQMKYASAVQAHFRVYLMLICTQIPRQKTTCSI